MGHTSHKAGYRRLGITLGSSKNYVGAPKSVTLHTKQQVPVQVSAARHLRCASREHNARRVSPGSDTVLLGLVTHELLLLVSHRLVGLVSHGKKVALGGRAWQLCL